VESRSVAIVVVVTISDEEIGVDHFVKKRFNKVFSRSEFQKGNTQPGSKLNLNMVEN
jgi:hypothetical protein